jgi:hypothetical protein
VPTRSYIFQLELTPIKSRFKAITTTPLEPRALLADPTAAEGTLFTAPSRLGHGILGVYAIKDLPFKKSTIRLICEFRSEREAVISLKSAHAAYLNTVSNNKDIVIRGHVLVDGSGNSESYCTHIQENLHQAHYNCKYGLRDGRIWIIQTAQIAANEELSIQYTTTGLFWKQRLDFPRALICLACKRYGITPPPEPVLPPTEKIRYSHVQPPNTTADLLDDNHYFHWPPSVPLCNMRIATLNVNGAFHDLARDKAGTLAELLDVAQISVMGITDARIPLDRCQSLKRQLHYSLPPGMAVIPFGTSRPHDKSNYSTTMGGQIFLIDRQWEKHVGHHRSDASGLALVTGIRITYNRSEL